MRLGDLDALYEKVADHVTSVSVCATAQQAIGQTDFKWRCLEEIRNAPTIDAIPVEWLKKVRDIYLKSYHAGHECDLHTAAILNDLIVDWRKEQKA